MLSVIILSVELNCPYAECIDADCHNAKSCYAECHGAN
jgi:hypothetical protein